MGVDVPVALPTDDQAGDSPGFWKALMPSVKVPSECFWLVRPELPTSIFRLQILIVAKSMPRVTGRVGTNLQDQPSVAMPCSFPSRDNCQ